jgi:hypothetical protein
MVSDDSKNVNSKTITESPGHKQAFKKGKFKMPSE